MNEQKTNGEKTLEHLNENELLKIEGGVSPLQILEDFLFKPWYERAYVW